MSQALKYGMMRAPSEVGAQTAPGPRTEGKALFLCNVEHVGHAHCDKLVEGGRIRPS